MAKLSPTVARPRLLAHFLLAAAYSAIAQPADAIDLDIDNVTLTGNPNVDESGVLPPPDDTPWEYWLATTVAAVEDGSSAGADAIGSSATARIRIAASAGCDQASIGQGVHYSMNVVVAPQASNAAWQLGVELHRRGEVLAGADTIATALNAGARSRSFLLNASILNAVSAGGFDNPSSALFDDTAVGLAGQGTGTLGFDVELQHGLECAAQVIGAQFDARGEIRLGADRSGVPSAGDDGVELVLTATITGFVYACSDGFDNDFDGLTDYPDDAGCSGPQDTNETIECSNGVDDDGDGFFDHPADAGCDDPLDDDERGACADGLDSDADTHIDLADPGCTDLDDLSETSPECSDGLDNDGDGVMDGADGGCAVGPENADTCSNGIDEDGDGAIDGADPGCADGPFDTSERSPTFSCDDGIDNDGDGQTDARAAGAIPPRSVDPDCYYTDPDAPLLGFEDRDACSDGVSNDADGLIDAADPGCSGPGDRSEFESFSRTDCIDGADNDGDGDIDFPADPECESFEDAWEQASDCNDGIDNDGDGSIDAADGGCVDGFESANTCSDGLDNDGDGAADLLDFGCEDGSGDISENTPTIVCDDGIDNDGDGYRDATHTWDSPLNTADANCYYGFVYVHGIPSPLLDRTEDYDACADLLDNDSDALVDAADDGCTGAGDASEYGWECLNGIDDDGDGRRDFPADPTCSSLLGGFEADEECRDGLDNDGDDAIDATDPGCTAGGTEAANSCSNGLDDDGDGRTDLFDPGCDDGSDPSERSALLECDDGIDNDGDGFTDIGTILFTTFPWNALPVALTPSTDINCHYSLLFFTDPALASEDYDACNDGLDNDGDGGADAEDAGCGAAGDRSEIEWTCSNGVDDDDDGLVDFPADAGCLFEVDTSERADACSDGIDNDNDGSIDWDDAGCTGFWDPNEAGACENGRDDDADGLVDLADPDCESPRDPSEVPACGLGAELVFMLLVLRRWRARRR